MASIGEFFARKSATLSRHWVEHILCCTLAVWIAGQIVLMDSTFAQLSFVSSAHLANFFHGLVTIVFIVGLFCVDIEPRPLVLVGCACAIFVTVATWRTTGDGRLAMLMILSLAAKDIGLGRLARSWTIGALAGLCLTLLLSLLGISASIDTIVGDSFFPAFGFKHAGTFAYAVFSIVVGMALSLRHQRFLLPLGACSIGLGILLFAIQRAARASLLLVVFGICLLAFTLWPRTTTRIATRPWVPMAVAALPFVLFLLSMDGPNFLGLDILKGSSYRSLPPSYSYSSITFLYLLYALGLLAFTARTRANSKWRLWILLVACTLYAAFLFDKSLSLQVEFNPTLLVLSGGFADLLRVKREPRRKALARHFAPRAVRERGNAHE